MSQMNYSERLIGLIIFIYCITLVASLISSIILACNIAFYYNSKYHGVHKTLFTFTGDYFISTDGNNDGVYYTSECHSITQFGDCYYECYETDSYEDAVNYAIDYCISNTTLVGYISNDDICWISNPNDKIYKILLSFRLISEYLVANVMMWVFIQYRDEIKSKSRPTKVQVNNPLILPMNDYKKVNTQVNNQV